VSDSFAAANTEVELINLSPVVESGQPIKIGLKFKCQPNYHIYWKNVGDAGTPPTINWKENPNIKFQNHELAGASFAGSKRHY
jgi:DsbC/DsbD-like thiol-disulfide interchange protein